MSDLTVPLRPVPAQSLAVTLGKQRVRLDIRQRFFGLYVDLYVNNALVLAGIRARDRNRLVRSAYLGFAGDLSFVDQRGTSDPTYDGLGSRFVLVYRDAS